MKNRLRKIETPLVLITFKRTDTLAQIVRQLDKYSLATLYIVSDGPRSETEAVEVLAARQLAETINAENVHKIYSHENLGLKSNLTRGISEALGSCDEVIVLEDDCLPSLDFLDNCDELSQKLRENPSLAGYCASSFLPSRLRQFLWISRKFNVWGWIVKREAWTKFIESGMLARSGEQILSSSPKLSGLPFLAKYEIRRILRHLHLLDTWDVQFEVFCIENRLRFLKSSKNLVTNIGFDSAATNIGFGKSLSLPAGRLHGPDSSIAQSPLWDYLEHSNKLLLLSKDFPRYLLTKVSRLLK